MSVGRLVAGTFFGALGGAGGVVALIQAGWVESSTKSVVLSVVASAVFGLVTTALARYRIARLLLSLSAVALSLVTMWLAAAPQVDAQAVAQTSPCVTAAVGDQVIDGDPVSGSMGSVQTPLRIQVEGAETVPIEIRTTPGYDRVDIATSIVEPVDVGITRRFTSTNLRLEDGRGVFDLEIVETSSGLGIRVDGRTLPLPFGTVRVRGTFSEPIDRTASPARCEFDLYFQVVSSAFDSLIGLIGIGALAVGALGLIALALTAARGAAVPGGATPDVRPPPYIPGTRPPAPGPPPLPQQPPPPPPAQPPPPPSVQQPTSAGPPPPFPQQPPPPPAQPPAAPSVQQPTSAGPPPPVPAQPPPSTSVPSTAVPTTPAPPDVPASVTPPGPGPDPVGIDGSVPEETAGGEPVIDPRAERFVQMRIAVDDFPEQGFIAGRRNELTFWIGPRVDSAFVAGSGDAVIETGRAVHLDARFEWPGGSANGEMTLPADRSQRSDPKFVVPVDIASDATRFGGTLYFWVRETGRLYEQVKIVGIAATQSHDAQPRLVSIVEDRGQIERITDESLEIESCVIHDGNSLFWYTGAEPAIFDATGFESVLEALSSAVANLQARSGIVDWAGDQAVGVLRTLAVEGAKLRYAIAGTIEPGAALQFFNHHAKSSMPLEWIYDRGHTAPDAELRPACIASLRTGLDPSRRAGDPFPCGCPPASALSAEVLFSNPVLCPWGFWGLAKVIERYDVEPNIRNNIAHPDQDRVLSPISSILLGANESLDRPSGRPGEEAIDLAAALARWITTNRVYTWPELQTRIASGGSSLVVTLPHQDGDSLQIGTDRLLLSQVPALLDAHLDGIILLLGCKTSQPVSEGFASFTRLFKDKAAVVIGSSATLVTTEAARLAIGIVHHLLAISQTDQPLGRAIVDARRSLFADGLPIALAINAIGDADWRFAVARQPLVPT